MNVIEDLMEGHSGRLREEGHRFPAIHPIIQGLILVFFTL